MITRTTRCLIALACLLPASALLTSCETTTTVIPQDYSAREVVELERWQVESAGQMLGHVVKYEIRDAKQPQQFYRVTDHAGRWVGKATANGRFSRRTPFEGDLDLGVLSMKSGVAQLFEASAPVKLQPVAVEAGWHKQPKQQSKR
ncbi:MAG: hypothetical protein ACI8UD_001870 [Planctomycetota bacterium]